jgi:hypothetical protein
VIQWLNSKEKELFLLTAFRVLKPGGRIAIVSFEKASEMLSAFHSLRVENETERNKPPTMRLVSKSDIESLLTKTGFEIVSSEYQPTSYTFESMDQCLGWMYGTFYVDESELSSSKRAEFVKKFTNEDGTVTLFNPTIYRIIAMKPLEKNC